MLTSTQWHVCQLYVESMSGRHEVELMVDADQYIFNGIDAGDRFDVELDVLR